MEPLTLAQIGWLRSLPQDTQPIEFGTATFGLAEWVFKSDQSDEMEWARTPAADTLLATLDSHTATAVKEERERVLAETDTSLRAFHRAFVLEVATLFEIDKPAARRFKALAQEFFEAATPQDQSGSAG